MLIVQKLIKGNFFSFSRVCLQLLLMVMTECRDLAISVLTDKQTDRQTEPITLLLVHAHGVMIATIITGTL